MGYIRTNYIHIWNFLTTINVYYNNIYIYILKFIFYSDTYQWVLMVWDILPYVRSILITQTMGIKYTLCTTYESLYTF